MKRRRSKRRCRCNPAGASYGDMGVAAALGGAAGYARVKAAKDAGTVALMRGVDQRAGLEVTEQGLKHFELTSAIATAGGVAAALLSRQGSTLRGWGSLLASAGAAMYAGGAAAGIREVRATTKFLPPAV